MRIDAGAMAEPGDVDGESARAKDEVDMRATYLCCGY